MHRLFRCVVRGGRPYALPCRRMSNAAGTLSSATTFLNGTNSAYVDAMYRAWRTDPNSIHKSWDTFFKTGSYTPPPTIATDGSSVSAAPGRGSVGGGNGDSARVLQLIRAFQVRGHLLADLDPLKLMPPRPDHEDLAIHNFGFTEQDMDRVIDISGVQIQGFAYLSRGELTLRQIFNRLKETYCGTIGYEYMHIPSVEKCNWLREKIETRDAVPFSKDAKLQLLDRLMWADHFEQFLKTKWGAAKRFGVEGAESFIAGLKSIIGRSSDLGVENVVIGMPHRGRLNVLSGVVRKDMAQIFCEFNENHEDDPDAGNGDVKYHLGLSHTEKAGQSDKLVKISLLANPSHLEAVDPVVLGKCRAKQFYAGDTTGEKTMGILVHGDAAFAAQGVVYETFQMQSLKDYSTGGTIHIVVNNQVGFTTDPSQARSSTYCTDIAKSVNAPVFHVNNDDPEAVVHVCQLASEWRQKFKSDVVVDLVCFRKHGHNEGDEPKFTQPLMYQVISQHPSTLSLYAQRLAKEAVVTDAELKALSENIYGQLTKAFELSKTFGHGKLDWLSQNWGGMKSHKEYSAPQKTGVELAKLQMIGKAMHTLPNDFIVHDRIAGVLKAKEAAFASGHGIDWGTAEQLAFGSLLLENKHVRLSGQDVERGTFSHRHDVLHDQKTNATYSPLNNLAPGQQAHLTVVNSLLSEYGVLGFEYGYSLENPHALVLWEAQFGDFFNTAQVIVDQFISSGEDKWLRQSGLTLLLPHGYEGAGPEHSSARLERFLQMCNDHPEVIPDQHQPKQVQQSNWQIANITTPANYFHALRRQLHRQFRKPLIVMSPKSLLRAKYALSSLEDFGPGTSFRQVIGEVDQHILAKPANVKRLIFCSGKVFYDLKDRREQLKANHVAIVRIEQIAPFPYHAVAAEISKFSNAELYWAQEEPLNMGAYVYAKDRIITAAKQLCNQPHASIKYVGRAPSAATAAGHMYTHKQQLEKILKEAFA